VISHGHVYGVLVGKSTASGLSVKDPSTPCANPQASRLSTILSAPGGSEGFVEASLGAQKAAAPPDKQLGAAAGTAADTSTTAQPAAAAAAGTTEAAAEKKGHRRGRSLSGLIPSLKSKPKRSASVLEPVGCCEVP
jgi:hypothetical protein